MSSGAGLLPPTPFESAHNGVNQPRPHTPVTPLGGAACSHCGPHAAAARLAVRLSATTPRLQRARLLGVLQSLLRHDLRLSEALQRLAFSMLAFSARCSRCYGTTCGSAQC